MPKHTTKKAPPLEQEVWYHPDANRLQTVALLKGQIQGTFLVRNSTTYKGDFSLCVAYNNDVEHYHVMHRDKRLTVDEDQTFADLHTLVEFYKKDDDCLCCRLTEPALRKGAAALATSAPEAVAPPVSQELMRRLGEARVVVERSEVEILESLGHGDFGDVCKGRFRGTDVAVKTLRATSAAVMFLQEAAIMVELKHAHLVRLLGVVLQGGVSLLTEFMARGSLANWLRTRGSCHVTLQDQLRFSLHACLAMEYLEGKHVVHRDLAARNVLLTQDSTAKVADFGLAKHEVSERDKVKFPIKWTAPEAIAEQRFTTKSDVWSYGVLLWEIFSYGRIPYPQISLSKVKAFITEGGRMSQPEKSPDTVYAVMLCCWQQEPSQRPSFAELLSQIRALQQ